MKFRKHSYLALEEVNLKCLKLLLRYSPSSIKDRQLRDNRAIAIDTGTVHRKERRGAKPLERM